MSKAQHRGPIHEGFRWQLRELRWRLIGWGSLLWPTLSARRRVTRRTARRVYRATPAEICHVGLTMADANAAATTNYPVQEPCAWGLSAGACAAWHPADHGSRYANV